MKKLTILFSLFLISCGGDTLDNLTNGGNTGSGGGDSGSTSGTITLSGVDTSITGTKLNTGFIRSSKAAGFQPDYIILVDKASTVRSDGPGLLTPVPGDFNNGFIIVVTDDSAGSGFKGISMLIVSNGTQFDYVCTTPEPVFTDCGAGSIDLNINARSVTFNNVNVANDISGAILTMNGTLSW